MDYNYGFENKKKRAADYRAIAWERLKGHYWIALLAGLVASVLGVTGVSGIPSISFDLNLGGGDADASAGAEAGTEMLEMNETAWIIVGVVGAIVIVAILFALAFSIFVSAPATTGYASFNLGIADENPSFVSLFRAFKTSYKQSVGLYIRYNLRLLLCMLPMILAVAAYAVLVGTICITMSLDIHDLIRWDSLLDLGWIMTVLILGLGVIFIAYVVSAVLSIVAKYKYSMCFMILADDPTLTSREALRRSASVMKGNKWRLFCLRLSFIGWMLLTVLTCGVGAVFLTPYVQAAEAVFYRDITGTSNDGFALTSNGHDTFGDGTFSS